MNTLTFVTSATSPGLQRIALTNPDAETASLSMPPRQVRGCVDPLRPKGHLERREDLCAMVGTSCDESLFSVHSGGLNMRLPYPNLSVLSFIQRFENALVYVGNEHGHSQTRKL